MFIFHYAINYYLFKTKSSSIHSWSGLPPVTGHNGSTQRSYSLSPSDMNRSAISRGLWIRNGGNKDKKEKNNSSFFWRSSSESSSSSSKMVIISIMTTSKCCSLVSKMDLPLKLSLRVEKYN